MPNINTINGLVLCDETNVNGVTIANITNIDGITKNCCTANGPVVMTGPLETCALACVGEDCGNYYTDGVAGTCPLVTGDILYADASCGSVTAGYYSPNPCVEGCDYCYSVNGSGVITVTSCPGTCRTISLASNTTSCAWACPLECSTYYTDTTSTPTTGDHIYLDYHCTCSGEGPEFLYYSDKCGARGGSCYTVTSTNCAITSVSACR